jgi:hypothetical protein
MRNLSINDAEIKRKFGTLGACEAIYVALQWQNSLGTSGSCDAVEQVYYHSVTLSFYHIIILSLSLYHSITLSLHHSVTRTLYQRSTSVRVTTLYHSIYCYCVAAVQSALHFNIAF